MSGNRSKSAFFKVGWVTLSAGFRGKEVLPTNHCWYQSNSDCPFVWYKNICSVSFSFVTMHACDRQTDGQNYDSQDHPRICSRGKNVGQTLMALNNLKCNCLTPLHFKGLNSVSNNKELVDAAITSRCLRSSCVLCSNTSFDSCKSHTTVLNRQQNLFKVGDTRLHLEKAGYPQSLLSMMYI